MLDQAFMEGVRLGHWVGRASRPTDLSFRGRLPKPYVASGSPRTLYVEDVIERWQIYLWIEDAGALLQGGAPEM
jgi:hypothetical protein